MNNRNLFLHSSGVWKFKVKGLLSSEDLSLWLVGDGLLPVSSYDLPSVPVYVLISSHKDHWIGPTLVTQFSSVAQSCPTLCDPMDYSTPGFPVHHQLLELTQTHVHHVSDAIQPSHPLSSPSSPAFSLSQHQGLFQ